MSLVVADYVALGTANIAALHSITPIVMDLTGVDALTTSNVAGLAPQAFAVLTSTNASSGIQTQQIGISGVTFDLGNTGATNANVGWITPGEGFLVELPAGATTISNGSELFGSATVLPNGQTAANGFAALSAFASNGKDVITSSDPIFNQLQVWVDTGVGGANGTTPTGTLLTLAELNIQSLNLNATAVNQASNGNTIGLISSFTTTDGKTHEMADVWLTSAAATTSAPSTINQLSNALSQYVATGATTGQNSGVGPLGAEPATNAANMQSNTSTVLASALSQYNANGQLIANTAPAAQLASVAPTSATSQLLGQTSTTQVTVTKNGSGST
jgi:hypothetical protein